MNRRGFLLGFGAAASAAVFVPKLIVPQWRGHAFGARYRGMLEDDVLELSLHPFRPYIALMIQALETLEQTMVDVTWVPAELLPQGNRVITRRRDALLRRGARHRVAVRVRACPQHR